MHFPPVCKDCCGCHHHQQSGKNCMRDVVTGWIGRRRGIERKANMLKAREQTQQVGRAQLPAEVGGLCVPRTLKHSAGQFQLPHVFAQS